MDSKNLSIYMYGSGLALLCSAFLPPCRPLSEISQVDLFVSREPNFAIVTLTTEQQLPNCITLDCAATENED